MTRKFLAIAFAAMAFAAPAVAQENATVTHYLEQGFAVVGVMPSNAGPGIFLQKEADLVVCFVSETPESPDLTTGYCKPVH